MVTKESFKMLLQKIVDKHLPDESIVFDIQGDEIIEDVFNNRFPSSETGHGDKFGAADLLSSKLVIELVVLAFTSYKVILEIIKLTKESKSIDLESIRQDWELRLKKGGIKSSRAKAITDDFIKEINDLIK